MTSILNDPRFAGATRIEKMFPDGPTTKELAEESDQGFERYAKSETRIQKMDFDLETGRVIPGDYSATSPIYTPQYTSDLSAMLFMDNELIGVVYADGGADFRSDAYENSVTGKGTDWLELAKQAAYDLGADLMVKPSAQPIDTTV
ncbi:hypothetical protein [Roseibium sp.]|uniref:hypothetical protein n=1 Tax=Roseibium sp. TaxID=1936156 RepID=UPI003B50CD3B